MYTRVYVEIINICNMHCSFCHGHSRLHRRMTLPEFSRILQQLQGMSEKELRSIVNSPLRGEEIRAAARKLLEERTCART